MKRNASTLLAVIIVLAVAGLFFVYPRGLGGAWRPWRLGLDLIGGSHLVYDIDLSKISQSDQDSVLNGIRDVIERRVNLYGVSEPQVFIARNGNQAELIVELAGVKDIAAAVNEIGHTPLLDFRVLEGNGTSTSFIPTSVTGRYISGAQVSFDTTTNVPQVSLTFSDEGAKLFEELTGNIVGKRLCIFLDGRITDPSEDCPSVQQKISGGRAVITGRFTLTQAQQLVERFNAGALPVPISLVNQQTVSPTLGTNSLNKAILAGVLGTLLVILFMIFYYRTLGIFASMALFVYIVVTLAIFKLIPITMSLAGLAGFILTIGMAVDANILIFERIKEEVARGLSKASALEEGFRRAWPSIRDSNVSTIITAGILYYFSSSFVRGFALTLFIGVIISLFSSITTTRTLLYVFLKDTRTAK